MAKYSTQRASQMRAHLAYLAARLIAEDGIQDYGLAKRKAARQAGVQDTRELPDNQEIEAALRAYQALYQAEAQPATLKRLREAAVKAMELFAAFSPYLTGSVLTGTAGEHSDVNLQLFADSAKDFEIFLINRDIAYSTGNKNLRLGDRQARLPLYRLSFDGVDVSAAVYATDDLRVVQKHKSDGRSVERAKLAEVKALLQTVSTASP
jgi:hypothetical protein